MGVRENKYFEAERETEDSSQATCMDQSSSSPLPCKMLGRNGDQGQTDCQGDHKANDCFQGSTLMVDLSP
ncbi:hypothetical protein Leryth_019628 [Lithospermum erythrorhizon]|nr:hypothetical protein Leryth_019628 [Lithospermum erythrorhizon]